MTRQLNPSLLATRKPNLLNPRDSVRGIEETVL